MDGCGLWFVSFISLMLYSYNQGLLKQVVKTIGKEADVTPVCGSATLDIIIFIICKIRSERSREEECHLMYRREQGLENQCDSRFNLVMINQTVMLRLNNLSPENNGSYTCECSYIGGTDVLQLNISVEHFVENEDSISPTGSTLHGTEMTIVGVSILLVVITAILGVVFICHRIQPMDPMNRHAVYTTLTYEEAVDVDLNTVMQKEKRLYSAAKMHELQN